jgi:hypothetical protein
VAFRGRDAWGGTVGAVGDVLSCAGDEGQQVAGLAGPNPGERSAHTWFVLHELLSYPRVRNYDGSWTE